MALKPGDRYDSPKALADDIEHWLADEPVVAYPEPLRTRAARWGRKHRTLVAGFFGLVTAAAIALAVCTVLIKQEEILTDKARQEAENNFQQAETARATAIEARAKSEAQERRAMRQLALSYIDRGVNKLQNGDAPRGLAQLWQSYSIARDADDKQLQQGSLNLLAGWSAEHDISVEHAAPVVQVAFSPDGTRIATASLDRTVCVWDTSTGKPLGDPLKHDDQVWAVAFSPDGSTIATASGVSARLWNSTTGKPRGQAMKHDGNVVWLTLRRNGMTMRSWLGSGSFGNVDSVSFSPDGGRIATASWDKTARLWDVRLGQSALGSRCGMMERFRSRRFALTAAALPRQVATRFGCGTAALAER